MAPVCREGGVNMALKALDIYKLLPKKNCKECGDPTCLTFAMKLASGKGDIEKCPYLDDHAKSVLGASTKPPVRKIKIGVGERSFTIGEEFVQFRHDKTFYHPPGIMICISDTQTKTEIEGIVTRVRDDVLPRIGMDLRLNGIAIRNNRNDPEQFRKAVSYVEEYADLPEVLMARTPAAAEAGLQECGNYRPLVHCATRENYREYCTLTKKSGAVLAIRAGTPDELAELSSLCAAAGQDALVLDITSPSLQQFISDSTIIRQHAITRTTPALGYPVFYDTTIPENADAAIVLGILKYGAVIVVDPPSLPSQKALLTLRQNIYTDPQKPIQMTAGLYRVGNPGKDAPVLMTVNFSLTYFTLQGYLESGRISCYLLIVDTEGLSVLTAVAAGKLNETVVRDAIRKYGVEKEVSHRTIIIPGYASPLSGRIEEETGWKVLVGPRDAAEIGEYIETEWKG
jgi:acetyl-CoA decarbonylase/synthase complex subunit gamma